MPIAVHRWVNTSGVGILTGRPEGVFCVPTQVLVTGCCLGGHPDVIVADRFLVLDGRAKKLCRHLLDTTTCSAYNQLRRLYLVVFFI